MNVNKRIYQILFKNIILQNSLVKAKLTPWGRVTHICIGKLTIIGSDNGLVLTRWQAIICYYYRSSDNQMKNKSVLGTYHAEYSLFSVFSLKFYICHLSWARVLSLQIHIWKTRWQAIIYYHYLSSNYQMKNKSALGSYLAEYSLFSVFSLVFYICHLSKAKVLSSQIHI